MNAKELRRAVEARKINNGIETLIIERKRDCGIGLQGSCESIARWLFTQHNIVTSPAYVGQVLQNERTRRSEGAKAQR